MRSSRCASGSETFRQPGHAQRNQQRRDFGPCSGHGQNGLTAPADSLDGLCAACRSRRSSQWQPAGHPDPVDSQAHKGGAEARKASRNERVDLFIAAREEGLAVVPAGERAGVKQKTAYRYEIERKDRLAAEQARLEALADGADS